MSTQLDTQIVYTDSITVQKIDRVVLDLEKSKIEVFVADYRNSDIGGLPYAVNSFSTSFSEVPEGAVKDNFRDVVNDVRVFARSKGLLGAGTDTNEIE